MAGVRAPLFGLDASGSIGDAITFSKWKGRAYVRIKATPSNPSSPGQVATRAMMTFQTQAWAALSAAQKAAWETLAAAENYSPFNAYVSYNMARWTQLQYPKKTPVIAAGVASVLGALTLTAGVRQFSLSQVITTANQGWGLAVAVSATTGFTPAKTDIVLVAQQTATPITGVVTPMTPGTWFVRTKSFSEGADETAWLTQVQVIVT